LSHDKKQREERLIEIVTEMVGSMIKNGELDPKNEEALQTAIRKCAKEAKTVYDTATEFLS